MAGLAAAGSASTHPGGGVEGGLVGLDVDGGEGGERGGREVLAGKAFGDQRDHFVGGNATLGADAGHQRFGMIEQLALAAFGQIADAHLDLAAE